MFTTPPVRARVYRASGDNSRGRVRPQARLLGMVADQDLSFTCHSVPAGMADHAAAQENTKRNDYGDVMTSGGTDQHEI